MKGLTKTAGRIALLACLLFTIGCTAQAAPTATAVPTTDLSVVKTEAAQTVVAQITSDAALTPSATLIPPTATAVPATATLAVTATTMLPTKAPAATIASTRTYITGTVEPVAFKATLLSLFPSNGMQLSAGEDIDGTIKFRNDGTATWNTGYHYRFVSGDDVSKTDSYYLTEKVAPGDSITLKVDILAPSASGTYDSTWQLFDDNNAVFYTWHFIIYVP
jgi:hypothetical protein